MMSDSTFVFGLIALAGALMASNRVRLDVIALMVVIALILSGVLSVSESLAGFGSPIVIVVAGLLIIGEMLTRTGVTHLVGDWIIRGSGASETRLLALLMLGAGLLGATMSSTAVVAIFIPVTLRLAAELNISRSRLLLPMSYAALISGMLTLIATTPNIVVHEELKAEGFEGFNFFGFTAIGLTVLVAAIIYMATLGRVLLPRGPAAGPEVSTARSVYELWRAHNVEEELVRASIGADSPLVGRTLAQSGVEERFRVRPISALKPGRRGEQAEYPDADFMFNAGDVLLLLGNTADLHALMEAQRLSELPRSSSNEKRGLRELGGVAVLIHPESELIGRKVGEAEFPTRFGLRALGLRRGTDAVAGYTDERLLPGDGLFLFGPWSRIRAIAQMNHDFVMLETPRELGEIVPSSRRMPVAIVILVAMVALSAFEIVPLVVAVLLAALAAVLSGCLTMEDAYRSIHWSSIVLIAGMLPLADALTATGATQMVVDLLLYFAGDTGPRTMLTILFFLTAALGLVLSNTASAVLVVPIAIYAARALEVSPYPFAIAVLIAASSAFSTPVSTPVVTLVVEPGQYRFADFVKLGVPLLGITYLVTLLLAPMMFPF
jgi:di/tricarboxylate transporter